MSQAEMTLPEIRAEIERLRKLAESVFAIQADPVIIPALKSLIGRTFRRPHGELVHIVGVRSGVCGDADVWVHVLGEEVVSRAAARGILSRTEGVHPWIAGISATYSVFVPGDAESVVRGLDLEPIPPEEYFAAYDRVLSGIRNPK